MLIQDVISLVGKIAPPALQEDYDNAGLITGDSRQECTGILISLDATEAVLDEAIANKCNLVVSHHPIVFRGLKKITGKNYVERVLVKAIKNDIALFAIHTNLDNIPAGVNGKIADLLGLEHRQLLAPKTGQLCKLVTFVPRKNADSLRNAIFSAGAGKLGNYSECSFNTPGTGTFTAGDKANPYVGEKNQRHEEEEIKIEAIFPGYLQQELLFTMKKAHPYEEVAYDIIPLANTYDGAGSGIIGELSGAMEEGEFLSLLKKQFTTGTIKHTRKTGRKLTKIAVCGGAGIFLLAQAMAAGADAFVTADVKYHEFFDADGRILLADIGHYESEQFTITLLYDILKENFPNFAVLKTGVNTNPVCYFP